MDLREAEDIKKWWQQYTEVLHKRSLHDPDNHDGVITHLEPVILECKVKWTLGSITTNKASGGNGIPVELFQTLRECAVKVLPKITGDGDCSHEIKRYLLLGRKVMTNLDCMLKSRDIALSTKDCLIKTMLYPVLMYGCESRTIKKAECLRIDAFELWCWRRLLRLPWTARISNQSIPRKSVMNIH